MNTPPEMSAPKTEATIQSGHFKALKHSLNTDQSKSLSRLPHLLAVH